MWLVYLKIRIELLRRIKKQDGNVWSRRYIKGSKSAKFLKYAQDVFMKSSETFRDTQRVPFRLDKNRKPLFTQLGTKNFFFEKNFRFFFRKMSHSVGKCKRGNLWDLLTYFLSSFFYFAPLYRDRAYWNHKFVFFSLFVPIVQRGRVGKGKWKNILSAAKYQTGDPSETKKIPKAAQCRKKLKGGPFSLVRFCMLRLKS